MELRRIIIYLANDVKQSDFFFMKNFPKVFQIFLTFFVKESIVIIDYV